MCEVHVHRRPWPVISDELLRGILAQACVPAFSLFEEWLANEQIKQNAGYGFVLLDPTVPPWAAKPTERVLAQYWFGDKARAQACVDNGLAKAAASQRLDVPNGSVIQAALPAFGLGEFLWGGGVCHTEVVFDQVTGDMIVDLPIMWGGGSGLSVAQDTELGQSIVDRAFDGLNTALNAWLKVRRSDGPWGWFNLTNLPGGEYANVHQLPTLDDLPR